MAFIIPNASDTAAKFANINQAEPDSLDMEALGNMLTACIRSGGEVTNSGNTINVAAGVAIFGGIPYSFSGFSFTNTAASANAFTAVIVRLATGVASVTTLNGTPSSTNPTLPKSASTLTGSYNSTTDFNPATDVLLAAVFRSSSTVSGHIVDKRIMFTGSLHWTQAGIPSASQGSNGDLVTVGSSVYVKAAGAWLAVSSQSVVDEIMPVGGVMAWPSLKDPTGVGSRWLECNGQSVSSATYPALATAWGVSGTFSIPDFTNRVLRGISVTPSSGIITTTGGADTASVPLKNHSHTMGNHTHTFPAHGHTATVTGNDGGHSHTGTLSNTAVTINSGGTHNHSIVSVNNYNAVTGYQTGVSVWASIRANTGATGFNFLTTAVQSGLVERAEGISVGGSGVSNTGNDSLRALEAGSHTHTGSVSSGAVTVSGVGNHSHTITVVDAASAASSSPSTNTSDTTGDGAAPTINTLPAYRSVRYFVRAV